MTFTYNYLSGNNNKITTPTRQTIISGYSVEYFIFFSC